jgi:hypothetical protein
MERLALGEAEAVQGSGQNLELVLGVGALERLLELGNDMVRNRRVGLGKPVDARIPLQGTARRG